MDKATTPGPWRHTNHIIGDTLYRIVVLDLIPGETDAPAARFTTNDNGDAVFPGGHHFRARDLADAVATAETLG